MRRVVVTGIGVVSPLGTGVTSFTGRLWEGKSGVSRTECFDPESYASQISGQVPDLKDVPEEGGAKALRWVRLAAIGSREALVKAGLEAGSKHPVDRRRIGVSISTAIGGTQMTAEHFGDLTNAGVSEIDVESSCSWIDEAATFNTASRLVAEEHEFEGPCTTVTTGCTGGNDAIGFAVDQVRRGEADVVVCGASEAPITPLAVAAFDIIGALSVRNDDPPLASRPFDKGRDGFVLSEGAGILVLEELDHARSRGAEIIAEIAGFGSTANAFHMTDLAPEGKDLARSLQLALKDAATAPEQLDYVNAHGSSTPMNDISETNAVKTVLGEHAYRTPVSSIKSSVGHALSAANAIEAVASVMTIRGGVIPPTINLEDQDEACDLDYVPNEAREARVDTVASLSSGFGGIHSTLVLKRFREGTR